MKKGPRSRQPKKGARSSLEARVDEDDQSNVEAGREEGDEGEEGEEMTLPEQGNKRTQSSAAAAAARVESEEDHLIDQDQTMPPSDLQRARSSAGQVDSTEDNTFNQEEVSQAKAADDSQMQPSTAAGIDDEDKDDEGASFGDDLIMPLPIPNNRRKRIQSSAAGTGDDAGPAPKSAKTNADPTSKPTPRRRGPGKARVQREAGDMTGPRRTGKAQSKAATKDETQNQDQQSVPEYSEDTAVLSVDRRSTGVPQKRKFLDRLIGDQEEADSLKNSVSASTALESTRSGGPSLSELVSGKDDPVDWSSSPTTDTLRPPEPSASPWSSPIQVKKRGRPRKERPAPAPENAFDLAHRERTRSTSQAIPAPARTSQPKGDHGLKLPVSRYLAPPGCYPVSQFSLPLPTDDQSGTPVTADAPNVGGNPRGRPPKSRGWTGSRGRGTGQLGRGSSHNTRRAVSQPGGIETHESAREVALRRPLYNPWDMARLRGHLPDVREPLKAAVLPIEVQNHIDYLLGFDNDDELDRERRLRIIDQLIGPQTHKHPRSWNTSEFLTAEQMEPRKIEKLTRSQAANALHPTHAPTNNHPPVPYIQLMLGQIKIVGPDYCAWCSMKPGFGQRCRIPYEELLAGQMCRKCAEHRFRIINHPRHTEWNEDLVSADALGPGGRVATRDCSVCTGLAVAGCKGCSLKVCVNCQVALDELCDGKLDEVIEMLGTWGIKGDASLLWSKPAATWNAQKGSVTAR